MVYDCDLRGEMILLEDIFVDNSVVLKEALELCSDKKISLVYEDMDKDLLGKAVKMLNFLVNGDVRSRRFMEEYMVEGNVGEIVRILNMVNYYDVKVLEEYLVEYFADRVRSCKDDAELGE